MIVLAVILSLLGCLALALGMARHYRELLKRPPSGNQLGAARALGVALITAGLAACLAAWPWGQALVVWLGTLSVGAIATVLILALLVRDR